MPCLFFFGYGFARYIVQRCNGLMILEGPIAYNLLKYRKQIMTINTRKARLSYTAKQKCEYARLMVEEHYSNQQIMDISGAGATAVAR